MTTMTTADGFAPPNPRGGVSMPYEMFEQDGQFCLRNQQTGKMVPGSCHKAKADTMAMMRALYANVPDARTGGKTMDSDWIDGGEVKALGEGKIGGYLVRFTTSADPDLTDDFFTQETDFFLDDEPKAWVLYDHGRDGTLKARKLGQGQMRIDDVGVWIEAQLKLRDQYEKAIYELAKRGKLGWSSGALNHLVEREMEGKAKRILSWPIGEASLTPNPAEFRNQAFSLKSFVDEQARLEEVERAAALGAVADALLPSEEVKAEWSSAYMNDLPDSSFAYIEPGGEKDAEGKTKPRSLRHFPYKDANGKLDEAHVRNALARIPQSSVSDAAKASALAKIRKAAASLGIEVSTGKSYEEDYDERIGILNSLPALKELLAPIDIKGGLDARSDAVVAAGEEIFRAVQLYAEAVKHHVARLQDNTQFRFEKDGRTQSKPKRRSVEITRDRVAKLIAKLQEVHKDHQDLLSMFDMTDAQQAATNEKARHELFRTFQLASTVRGE